jgi:hypothetical protein
MFSDCADVHEYQISNHSFTKGIGYMDMRCYGSDTDRHGCGFGLFNA